MFVIAENVEIGNGYGVPGGRAYFSGPRPPMFTLPAAHMYKQENNFSPSNSMLEGVASGCAQGSVDPAQGLQRPLDGSGAKAPSEGKIVEQRVLGRREVDMKEVGVLGEKGDLPDYLREKLKARGILKDESIGDTTALVG